MGESFLFLFFKKETKNFYPLGFGAQRPQVEIAAEAFGGYLGP
jgi:hypothetical protein